MSELQTRTTTGEKGPAKLKEDMATERLIQATKRAHSKSKPEKLKQKYAEAPL